MFADYVKMGVKAAIIITVTTTIIAIFANIQIPAVDTTSFTNAIAMGKAFINYWVPILTPFVNIFVFLLGLELAAFTATLALIAIRWVLKVNE